MRKWIRQWLARRQQENDLDEEIRSHLAIEKFERLAAGEEPGLAEESARRVFGNSARIREEVRETWGWPKIETFGEDLRFGLRMLRKTPLWTTMICATLALGIGLSTAIFSVAYGVLLQPLPYPDPASIVAIWPATTKHGTERFRVSAALWMYWREHSTLVDDIALTRPVANFNLTGEGAPERLQGARTTFNVPSVLRVQPLLGRTFDEQEQLADAKVAVLSHGLWKRRFGGDSAIIGRKIQLNGEPFEVIGVMPPEYRYPNGDFEIWTPLYFPPGEIRHGMNYQYLSIGRLKPGVRLEQAKAEFSSIMSQIAQEHAANYRAGNEWIGSIVEPLVQSDAFHIRSTLYVLLGAVGCLLAIGCMNLAVLLIARASARSREMAVRVALGASRGRLRRQLIAEMIPLSLGGTAGGLLLAGWMLQVLLPLLPTGTPRVESIGLHGPVVAFAVGASLLVVLLASLLPGSVAARTHPAGTLQQSSRSVAGGGRTRDVLTVAQIAVTTILVVGGMLFARSFGELLRVNPGFSSEGVLTMHLAVTRAKYPDDVQVADYYRRLRDSVTSIPGVIAAGVVNRLPLSGLPQTGGIEFEGLPKAYDADWRSATPGYFEAIGIPLKYGRLFSDPDLPGSPNVGLIDERMARAVFGAENPIGKRFRRNLPGFPQQDPWVEIVGVVGHVLNDNLENDPRPQVYWPETQRAQDRGALVIRVTGRPETYTKAVIAKIHEVNPEQPVYDVRTMDQWVERTVQSRKLLTGLVSLFGVASLLLACLGLYGVVSYASNLRGREFGIRLALGAAAGHVRGLVLKHAAKLAVGGLAIGLVFAWMAGRALESLLFGVTKGDPISWMLAPGLLILVALLAGLGPARSAARSDPAVTLRAE